MLSAVRLVRLRHDTGIFRGPHRVGCRVSPSRGSPGNIPATIASLLSGNLSANNVYTPQPTDWSAQQMIENAQSLAGIQALSQRAYQAGADRLLQLAGLRVRLATANDPKEVMDLQAQIAAAQSDAQAQQIQAGNIQTLAALQPRVMEQRDEEHERLTICNYIAFLRGNEDGIAPAPDCTSQSVGTMATGQADLTPGGSGAGSGSGSALASMMNQSWGQTAANNAAALGVNPEALAATCVVESGCQNISNANSTASGPFQMIDSAYQADLQQALATNPELASQVVGKSDPATESIAAAEYLKSAATGLQQSNIPNPTVLDVRGAYQFGPANAAALATADDSQSMSSILANYSQQTLAANGITPGMTVGQWRQSIVNKLGPSAYAPVLATNT